VDLLRDQVHAKTSLGEGGRFAAIHTSSSTLSSTSSQGHFDEVLDKVLE